MSPELQAEMTKRDYTFDVAVYLRGDALDPNHVSEILDVEPTKAHYKGEKRQTSTERTFVTKVGLWALEAESKSFDLPVLIDELTSKIRSKCISLLGIYGVQEAYVDVFIAVYADENGGSTCEFVLNGENLRAIREMGVPIRFTITTVRR